MLIIKKEIHLIKISVFFKFETHLDKEFGGKSFNWKRTSKRSLTHIPLDQNTSDAAEMKLQPCGDGKKRNISGGKKTPNYIYFGSF